MLTSISSAQASSFTAQCRGSSFSTNTWNQEVEFGSSSSRVFGKQSGCFQRVSWPQQQQQRQAQSSKRSQNSRWRAAAESDSGFELERQRQAEESSKTLPEVDIRDVDKVLEVLDLQMESAFAAPPKHYEIVFLIHENKEAETEDILSKLKDAVEEKRGKIWRLNNWGLRTLAYKIQKARKAVYILMNIEIAAEKISEIDNILLKDERIIRYLMFKQKQAITEDCPPPPVYNEVGGEEEEEEEEDEEYEEYEEYEEDYEDGEEDDEDEDGEEEGESVVEEHGTHNGKPSSASLKSSVLS